MITNNNFSGLPWYSSLKEQNHCKKYVHSQIYPLLVPASRLIPFQISIDALVGTDMSNYSLVIYDVEGRAVSDNKIESFINSGLYFYSSNNSVYKTIMYTAEKDLDFVLPFGQYYMVLADRVNTWYSEIFTVTDVSNCLKLEWWDNTDFIMHEGLIAYTNGFKNILYINSEIGKPKYQYEEEGDERDGIFFAEKQISEKVYNFAFVAPEYLCDAIRFVRLSDNVVIEQRGQIYKCNNTVIEVDWTQPGDLASVSVEFKLGHVAKKIAPGFDDYSKDYNNDYNV